MVWQSRAILLAVFVFSGLRLCAQDIPQIVIGADTINSNTTIIAGGDTIRPSKYVAEIMTLPEIPFFQGFTLSADVFGPILYLLSDYGSAEAALRVSLKNTYFPVAEIGYGKCDHTDGNTNIAYSVAAPFLRAGLDYNILKDKRQDNRLTVGARYGFTTFKYDMTGPDMTDPVWGGTAPFNYKGASSTCQWIELVFGVQVRILKHFHMGWSVRYKQELSIGANDHSRPYYVPGYGTTTNTSCWGGMYNLIFDLRL